MSVRAVKISEAILNIETYFYPYENKHIEHVGHSIVIDKITGQERPFYLPETDEMAEFCQKHIHHLKSVKMSDNLTNVFEAAQAVKDGKVHIRKEFTCLIIACHAAEQYSTQSVILSPMCKHDLISDSVQLIITDLRAWKSSAFDEIL